MGAKLTHSQQNIYIQVKSALAWGNFCFSRGELKHFIHWLFKHFPYISWDSLLSKDFWDQVGIKLGVLQSRGDLLVGKFYPLFATIVKCVKGIEECLGKAIPSLKTPLPHSSPCIPDPSALLQEKSGDRSHQGVQSFCHLPDVSQSLFFPAQRGAGRAVPVSSLDLLPVPTCPVPSTLVISQDGSDHVAAVATAILQSRDPPLPAPAHIMAPGPFSIPSSAHHASMGVFASGPLQWETPPSCRPHLSLLCSHPLHWWLCPWEPTHSRFPRDRGWKWGWWQLERHHLSIQCRTASGGPSLPKAPHHSQALPLLFGRGEQ